MACKPWPQIKLFCCCLVGFFVGFFWLVCWLGLFLLLFFGFFCLGLFLFRKYFDCGSFGNAEEDHVQLSLLWRSVYWMSASVFQRLNIDFYAGQSIFPQLKFTGTKPTGETAGWAHPRSFEGSLCTPSAVGWNWEVLSIWSLIHDVQFKRSLMLVLEKTWTSLILF